MTLTLNPRQKLSGLLQLNHNLETSQLPHTLVEELQTALNILGYNVGPVDGIYGPATRRGWVEFKTDEHQGNPNLIGTGSVALLVQRIETIAQGRVHTFSTRQGTIDAILWECDRLGLPLKTQKAYCLATVQWETNDTFQPVREAYWQTETWRKGLWYYPYYGRGYVQLTHAFNYRRYGQILGLDLINKPDQAMNPNVALFILVHGMKTGNFTGRKMEDYINLTLTDFNRARRVVNGNDKAEEIAAIAQDYLAKL